MAVKLALAFGTLLMGALIILSLIAAGSWLIDRLIDAWDYGGDEREMKFKVNTKVFPDGRIEQELVDLQGRIVREVMDTKDQQARQALISLGWTPPDGLASGRR